MGRKKKMPLAVNRGEVPGKVRMHFPAHPDPARTVGATRLPAVSAPRISSSHASPQTCPNPNEVTSRGRGEPRRAGGAGTAFREAELRQETSPRSEANSRGLLPRAAVRGAARRGARGAGTAQSRALALARRPDWGCGTARLGPLPPPAPAATAAAATSPSPRLRLPPFISLAARPPARAAFFFSAPVVLSSSYFLALSLLATRLTPHPWVCPMALVPPYSWSRK